MNLTSLFDPSFCDRLAITLVHFLWQGAAVALVAGLAVAALRRAAAHARYGVLVVAQVVMVCCPPVTFLALNAVSQSRRPQPDSLPPSAPSAPTVAATTVSEDLNSLATPNEPQPGEYVTLQPDVITVSEAVSLKADVLPRAWNWRRFAPVAVATYLAGVMILLGRLGFGLHGGRRLCRRAEPVRDPVVLDALARQAKALGLRLVPAVAFCRDVIVPTVVGVLRPTILLPLALATGLAPDQLEAILAHELAHIRRFDHFVNLLQRLIEAFLFFHPAVWWLSHRIRIEREHCCDDLAVAVGGQSLAYAGSLLTVAELCQSLRPQPVPQVVGLTAIGRPSRLRQRIARLLGGPDEPVVRLGPSSWLSVIVVAFALGGAIVLRDRAASFAQQPSLSQSEDLVTSTESEGIENAAEESQGNSLVTPNASDQGITVAPTGDSSEAARETVERMDRTDGKESTPDEEPGSDTRRMDVRVAGVCLNAEVGHPISDAEVRFYVFRKQPYRLDLWKMERTDEQGRFLITGKLAVDKTVDPRRCEINVVVPGRATRIFYWQSESNYDPPVELKVEPPASLQGTVVGPDGKPVAGAVVHSGPNWKPGIHDAVTDEAGQFEIKDLTAGDKRAIGFAGAPPSEEVLKKLLAQPNRGGGIYFHVVHPTYGKRNELYATIPATVNVQLETSCMIEGRVIDADGEPRAKVLVQAQGPRAWAEKTTDTNGKYRFVLQHADKYKIWVGTAGDTEPLLDGIQATAGTTVQAPDIRFHKPAQADRPNATTLNPAKLRESDWGSEQDGLCTRLVLLTEKPAVGQPLKFRLEMKNFGKVERHYDPQNVAPFRVVSVRKANGETEPFIGPTYQTAGGPKPIKPGETVVLWDEFDAAENFLLAEPGKYVVQSSGSKPPRLPPLPGVREPNQSGIPSSNAVSVELGPGTLPQLKATFLRLREITPEKWRISLSGRVIFLTHSPTSLKKDVTTIQLWFDEKEHPPGYSLGEGANKVPVDRLGKTPLGFAYMTAPARAAELWPEYAKRILARIRADEQDGKPDAGPATTERPLVSRPEAQAVHYRDAEIDAAYRELISAKDSETASAAAERLGRLGNRAAVTLLVCSRHETLLVRHNAFVVLMKLFPREEFCDDEVIAGLNDRDVTIVELCATHLGKHKIEKAREALAKIANDLDRPANLRKVATESLAQLGEREATTVGSKSQQSPITVDDSLRATAINEPWIANGRVTDADGKPMPGVEVLAHCGVGTLRRTGTATTDADGRYELKFGPGIRFTKDAESQVQAATISVFKTGFFEKNLNRQGDLWAWYKIDGVAEPVWGRRPKPKVFLPGEPKEINFVMLPAARVAGKIVWDDGEPLEAMRLSLTGDDLPPSSSVAALAKTDKDGRFEFRDVPTGFRFQILIEPAKGEPPWLAWASAPMEFLDPGEQDFHAVFHRTEYLVDQFQIQLRGNGVNWREAIQKAAEPQERDVRDPNPGAGRDGIRERVHLNRMRVLLGKAADSELEQPNLRGRPPR